MPSRSETGRSCAVGRAFIWSSPWIGVTASPLVTSIPAPRTARLGAAAAEAPCWPLIDTRALCAWSIGKQGDLLQRALSQHPRFRPGGDDILRAPDCARRSHPAPRARRHSPSRSIRIIEADKVTRFAFSVSSQALPDIGGARSWSATTRPGHQAQSAIAQTAKAGHPGRDDSAWRTSSANPERHPHGPEQNALSEIEPAETEDRGENRRH